MRTITRVINLAFFSYSLNNHAYSFYEQRYNMRLMIIDSTRNEKKNYKKNAHASIH